MNSIEYENYILDKIRNDYDLIWHWKKVPISVLHENNILINKNILNKYCNNDIGFDIVAQKNGQYYFIQCKNYERGSICINALSGFYFLIHEYNLNGIVYYNGILSQRIIDLSNNKIKFINITFPSIKIDNIVFGDNEICKYLHEIANKKFISIKENNKYILYEYNNKTWSKNTINIYNFIENDLYKYIKNLLINNWTDDQHKLIKELTKIKKVNKIKDKIIRYYSETYCNNNIKFDENWRLLGFTNGVYDMEEEIFREYKYDDYISITTGYDWREPTDDEMETMNDLINKIMPIEEEKNLYLQLLCTSIEGKCLEKFIIFNGSGGNGKGMINDLLLLALGNYALIGNNAILFECSKTGSNPEKANIHKKRLVIFREPSEKHKFENSIIKELTGGGTFSARTHHEKETEKKLNSTIIVECNKKPLFVEDPQNAEIRRIIDLYFRSTFTEDINLIDNNKYIYKANPTYKTIEFQEKHKYALLKILMNEHKKYYKLNNCILTIPKSVEDRTKAYLELSCNILQWFKDNYSVDDNNVCKMKDIFDDFVKSIYYFNLSKMEKRKYNKSFFVEYFETNIFLRKHFIKIRDAYCIKGWTKNIIDE